MIKFIHITVLLFYTEGCAVKENFSTVETSRNIMDTVTQYPRLNFKLPINNHGWLWNMKMEERYLKGLSGWNENPLKVFVVPFSHNDAGWLETFEAYYEKKTRHILNLVAEKLPTLPGMKFVWSEICFLQRWWDRASPMAQAKLKNSAKNGQLEILTGGWVMADEATTHLFSLVDQLIEGHQWLKENLDVIPETSWSIDPFGLSSTMPYLLAESGVKGGLIIQRVHYAWKRYLGETANLDLVWKQDFDQASEFDMPLRVQHGKSYSVTASCGPSVKHCPQFDFNPELWNASRINFRNIRHKAEFLVGQYGREGSMTRDNTVLITVGDDFRFENASEWWEQYRNYAALFNYINSNHDLFHTLVSFATPKDYFYGLSRNQMKLQGDFFVYSDLESNGVASYWSGYFTTRPFFKRLCRKLESAQRATEIIYTVTINLFRQMEMKDMYEKLAKAFSKLIKARRTLALFQHHDAVTGTSRADVVSDYGSKLSTAYRYLQSIQTRCVGYLLKGEANGVTSLQPLVNFLENHEEVIDIPKKIVVYNSLPHERDELITLKVSVPSVRVLDAEGNLVVYQLNPTEPDSEKVKKKGYSSGCCFELVFIAHLNPLSLSVYNLEVSVWDGSKIGRRMVVNTSKNERFCIHNNRQKLFFDPTTGLPLSLVRGNESLQFRLDLGAYRSTAFQSGAYLFMPEEESTGLNPSLRRIFVITEGPVYSEVMSCYGSLIAIRTRLYHNNGPLGRIVDITATYDFGEPSENVNLEMFARLKTGLNGTKFYTDVNSFQFRRRDFVPYIGIEGNYYPATSCAYIETCDKRLTVMADHSHGVMSMRSGMLEVMLDRRTLIDDNRGLEEGVLDSRRTQSRFFVLLESIEYSDKITNLLTDSLLHPSRLFRTENCQVLSLLLLSVGFPEGIHLLNLRTMSNFSSPLKCSLMVIHDKRTKGPLKKKTFKQGTAFNGLKVQNILRTTLTGVKEIEPYDDFDDVCTKKMNLQTIKIIFK